MDMDNLAQTQRETRNAYGKRAITAWDFKTALSRYRKSTWEHRKQATVVR